MTILIVEWNELDEERKRLWVKILVNFMMAGGDTLENIARRLRLEVASELEVRSPSHQLQQPKG